MKFTPYWINAPTKKVAGEQSRSLHFRKVCSSMLTARARADIERWSDRFKPKASATVTLATLNDSRKYARELLPGTPAELLFDTKKRGRDGEGRKSHLWRLG